MEDNSKIFTKHSMQEVAQYMKFRTEKYKKIILRLKNMETTLLKNLNKITCSVDKKNSQENDGVLLTIEEKKNLESMTKGCAMYVEAVNNLLKFVNSNPEMGPWIAEYKREVYIHVKNTKMMTERIELLRNTVDAIIDGDEDDSYVSEQDTVLEF